MKSKASILLLTISLIILAACQTDPTPTPEPTQAAVVQDVEPEPAETPIDKVSVADCPEPTAGTHQLLFAGKGICFLFPEQYDAFQAEDGSGFTLYVKSLLNTEAPSLSLQFEPAGGRPLGDVVAQSLIDYALLEDQVQDTTLGGQPAILMDNLPGQDLNRRVTTINNDIVYNLVVNRIGPDYGPVGEEAEALFDMVTSTFQFIGVEPEAPLLAGPECLEATAGTIQFTNEEDGFCLLLPEAYTVDDSLTSSEGGTETAAYVGSLQDVAHARLFITVEDAAGMTLDEVTSALETEVESAIPGLDLISSFGYMLDGEFANQFDQVPGQDLSRQVVMVHDGQLHKLVFIPDDEAAGEAYTEMLALYDLVMDSFNFTWEN